VRLKYTVISCKVEECSVRFVCSEEVVSAALDVNPVAENADRHITAAENIAISFFFIVISLSLKIQFYVPAVK
jgi:hypothetical protein